MAGKVTFEGQSPEPGQAPEMETPQQGSALANAQAEKPANAPDTGLSEKRIREIMAEEVTAALEKSRREAQSLTAKAENRIKTMVQQQIDLLKQAGVQVGADQAQAIEKVIRQQEANTTEQPESGGDAPQNPNKETVAETRSPVDEQADKIMDAMGVDLTGDDPEAQTLDRSSEKGYITSLINALIAKQSRLAGARMPMGGGNRTSGTATAHMDGTATLEYAFSKYRK